MSPRTPLRSAFALILLTACPAAQPPRPDLTELAAKARAAYEAGDFQGFLEHTEEALALAPDHPRLLYNLACGRALTGRSVAALEPLQRLARMRLLYDLEADPDLAPLRTEPGYPELLARFAELREPRIRSTEAFRLPTPDFIPEGVAYDPIQGVFFVGSVRHGAIVRVRPSGADPAEARVSFLAAPGSGLGSVLGLVADPEGRALWAATADLPQLEGPRPVLPTALVRFDLEALEGEGGPPFEALGPPPGVAAESFNDLALASDGTVFVSDSATGALFRLPPGGEALELWQPPGSFRSPQGLVLSADATALYVADYSQRIFRVELASGRSAPLPAPEDLSLSGIDGLARAGGDLIAIQNGVRPHRVLRLELDARGRAIRSGEILEMNHPAHQEPTLGVVVGSDFYYVANSQWNRFDSAGGLPPADQLELPLILRLPLADPPPTARDPRG